MEQKQSPHLVYPLNLDSEQRQKYWLENQNRYRKKKYAKTKLIEFQNLCQQIYDRSKSFDESRLIENKLIRQLVSVAQKLLTILENYNEASIP